MSSHCTQNGCKGWKRSPVSACSSTSHQPASSKRRSRFSARAGLSAGASSVLQRARSRRVLSQPRTMSCSSALSGKGRGAASGVSSRLWPRAPSGVRRTESGAIWDSQCDIADDSMKRRMRNRPFFRQKFNAGFVTGQPAAPEGKRGRKPAKPSRALSREWPFKPLARRSPDHGRRTWLDTALGPPGGKPAASRRFPPDKHRR